MKNKRGSLLIAGLWAMSLFSVMSASLSFSAFQEAAMLKRDLADFKTHLDFVSALNQVAARIEGDGYPHEDSPFEPWFGKVDLDPPFEGMSVQVEDEESKLNLNYAPEALLSAFFKVFEKEGESLKGDRKDYVKEISKLKSRKRMQSLEELLLMEGFEKEDLEKLRPYVTVYSELNQMNINTAKPLVLKALLNFLSGDSGAKQIFFSRFESKCQEEDGCLFLSSELQPAIFAEKLKLPKTPVMLMLVQEFLFYVTTDSETFHLSMKAGESKAEGIFRYQVGQLRPEVLAWHES